MTWKTIALTLGLASLAAGPSLAQQGYDQNEVLACEGDAFRLCLSSIPNEAEVETCFRAHMAELSPACRHKLEPTPPPAPTRGRKRR